MKKIEIHPRKKEFLVKWEEKLSALFRGEIPTNAEWTNPADIACVFQAMQGTDTYFFQPGDGGVELQASRVTIDGLLEWSDDDDPLDTYAFIVKPLRLIFWNPGAHTHEASFVLEVDAMAARCPSGQTTEVGVEECVELSKDSFAPRNAWDSGEYQGKPLPDSARLIRRATRKARFALFSKGSLYNSLKNSDFDAYNAYHNDPVVFEKIVANLASIKIV
jgi:serine/threonine-protein kinase